jgi:hypothetical protein
MAFFIQGDSGAECNEKWQSDDKNGSIQESLPLKLAVKEPYKRLNPMSM